ncbi:MAG: cold shock domain-containing protein, partial [Acidimicrobiia bacterium]|nr:cold shock domain-containing protein [Acidimicrobiia bacterium]
TVTITATDDGPLSATGTFTLTVTNTNQAPTVDPIADQSVAETAPFSLIVSGSDPDLTIPFLNVTGLPAFAGFTDNGDGTATLTGTPGYTDAGAHLVTITATDDGPLSATETFTLTVTNTNRAPVVDPIANATVAEADTLTPIIVTASDPDLTIPTLSSVGLPAWAGFIDNEDGTATITGTPGYTNAGAHLITITATDGTLTNDDLFSLTVTNTNQAPIAVDDAVLLPADAVSVVVSVLLNDGDPDDDPISLTSFDSTTVGALTEEGPGLFRYTPGTGAPYAETFSYTISDTAGLTATATVFLSVTVPAALPPTPVVELPSLIGLAPISGAELDVVRFTAGASTPADVRFALVDGPPGATIHPVTGVFTWTPTERQGPGEYTLRVRMTDPAGELLDDRPIAVTITELHSTPRLRPAGPFHIEPGTTLTATIRADDVDVPSSPPRYELSGPVLPGVSIHPATGLLTWDVPADQDSGQTTITLRAVDGSDPGLYDEMTITVTVGAESSSDRRATLISGLLTASDEPGFTSPAGVAESGVKRTLVIMARAGMGSARAFGAPFALLALLTVIVLAFGRVSIHPLLGRSKRMAGTVAWFDAESGYGFIIPDRSAEELFLHRTALTRGKTAVTPGDRVTFRTVKGSERSFALRVRDEGES